MKLTTLILFIALMQVSAASIAQRVTYIHKQATLKEIITQIRQQTSYNVLVSIESLNDIPPTDVNFKNTPVNEVLDRILKDLPYSYEIKDNTILIKEKEKNLNDKIKAASAQVTITGRVLDETGKPLVGVNVTIKSMTGGGTATDSKGNYTITVPDEKTIIRFTFIGYEPQEYSARELQNGATITLKPSVENLKEVVVSKGYYNTTQELNTGNVTRVSGEDIAKQPGINPIQALEGRVAGLYITQTSGIPGTNQTVRLRGQNSLQNGNDPLYIIDGVPFSPTSLTNPDLSGGAAGSPTPNVSSAAGVAAGGLSPFNLIDVSNIESIEVLKDADATAIYGSRGANGVILITTKKGTPGKSAVDVNLSQGFSQIANKLDLMNTKQYLDMRKEALKNDGRSASLDFGDYDLLLWDQNSQTDWQKVMIGGTAQYTNASASVSGGSVNDQFNIGGNYSRQTTVFPGNYFDQKGSAHINLNHSSNDRKFHANMSAQYGYDNNVIPQADFTGYITLAPNAPSLRNSDGSINWGVYPSVGQTIYNNPFAQSLQTAKATTSNLISNLMLSYEILPGLVLKSSVGYTKQEMNQTIQSPLTAFYGAPNPLRRANLFGSSTNDTWILEPQINYTRQIAKGKFAFLVGMTQQQNVYNSASYTARGFSTDELIANPGLATYFIRNGFYNSDYHYAALYSRISYDWEEKYLINLVARRDGSSRFGPGNQFGNFGSLGAGWIFSKERFATNFSFLSFGKLRASYGTTGNDQIGDYQFLSTYSNFGTTYQGVQTLAPTLIANPHYAWEVNKKFEIGLDLGFLQDRIYLTADYFRNRSGNQLVGFTLPFVSGFNNVIANLPAVVQNTGLEFQINSVNIKTKSFRWTSTLNLTVPRNKLVAYPGLSSSPYLYAYSIGKSISQGSRYHYTGVNPTTGLYTFQDVNGDGVLDVSDLQFTGGPMLYYFGGINNTFSYKRFQLDIFLQFTKQTSANYYSSFAFAGLENGGLNNFPSYFVNAWRSPGDLSSIQRYTSTGGDATTTAANLIGSDAAFNDASFIRLKNVQLVYRLPEQWSQKIFLRNLSLFIQGQNLLTITNYKGMDPETQSVKSLPPLRTITGGLQLGL